MAAGDPKNGEKVYTKRCWWCHGKKGGADGPGAKFMIPPPRNFADGVYKYKSGAGSDLPRDEDLFRMISDGMAGTSMPSWKEALNDQERWDVVAYIKTLTDAFKGEKNPAEIAYASPVASSPESIEKGKKLFKETKCFECHGEGGKGNTMKKLKEDSGAKLWPRNLTKPWTFRAGSEPNNIFARISNGIPTTPMPAHAADKTGNGKLSVEDRWHVVNFVKSIADDRTRIKEGEIVVKGQARATLPKDEKDPAWNEAAGTSFFLVPQIIQKERFFHPSNDSVYVKAIYSEKEVAFLLEWDDRTKSVVGDPEAEGLAWGTLAPDAIAIQTPVSMENVSEKPYFGHGDPAHMVSVMYWNSGSADKGQAAKMFTAQGTGKRDESDAAAAGFTATGSYNAGTWKVMMKRKLVTANKAKDTQFEAGKYFPMAFANWDGSNGEAGSMHTMTSWRWLLLRPETGSQVVTYPLAVFAILVVGQFIFSAMGRRKEN
jgi:DMSO reductase family type II enzyme heme b subunit